MAANHATDLPEVPASQTSQSLQALFPQTPALLYETNPFQVLKLPTTASDAEAQKTADRMHIEAELGAKEVDGHLLQDAMQCLRNPRRRLLAELFWFHVDGADSAGSVDREAYNRLMAGDWDGAARLWTEAANRETMGSRGMAVHNLAILCHRHVLTFEAGKDPLHRRFPIDKELNREYIQVWETALRGWAKFWNDPRSWDALRQRVVEIGDPRLPLDYIEELRSAFPELLLRINRDLASQYLRSGHFDVARQHLDLMMRTGFDRALALTMCKAALDPLKERVKESCEAAKKQLQNVGERAQQVAQDFRTQIGPEIQKLKLLDPEAQLSTGTARDEVADVMRLAAIALANHTHSHQQALDMLQEAEEYAVSPSQKSRMQEDIKTCRELLQMWGDGYSPDLCWFCKKRTATGALERLMHQVTSRSMGMIYYNTLTVKIPRCGRCTWWDDSFPKLCGILSGLAGIVIGGAGGGVPGAFWLGLAGYGMGWLLGMAIACCLGAGRKGGVRSYPPYKKAKQDGFVRGKKPATS